MTGISTMGAWHFRVFHDNSLGIAGQPNIGAFCHHKNQITE